FHRICPLPLQLSLPGQDSFLAFPKLLEVPADSVRPGSPVGVSGRELSNQLGILPELLLGLRNVRTRQRVRPAEDDGPGEEKDHFYVENHEQERHHVETQVELDPGAANGRFAALINCQLVCIWLYRTDESSHHQVDEYEEDSDCQEQ